MGKGLFSPFQKQFVMTEFTLSLSGEKKIILKEVENTLAFLPSSSSHGRPGVSSTASLAPSPPTGFHKHLAKLNAAELAWLLGSSND